ncbi:hypothetical protein D8674_023760 [Pyrus ussuriensis x Pyrus communis]|uniref:Uncharacterized protein n=1 Tax=Pyrus ussuriensis x Pyrus communis TaxID=2448454 RepID=A0A5N5H1Y4_9ROSA|nr:hypothetical protein D8674_023760 [Pyrus ussuriensis x Pyrus communis]
MQKRFRYGSNVNDADGGNEHRQHCAKTKKEVRKKPGKVLTTKIRSVFVNAFGSMRIKSPDGGSLTKSKTKRNRVVGEHGSSGNLNRAPSKLMVTGGRKSSTGRSLGRMLSREFDEGDDSRQEEREGEELCKKRILMGGKCKPLSLSGTLQYAENGILVTEFIP